MNGDPSDKKDETEGGAGAAVTPDGQPLRIEPLFNESLFGEKSDAPAPTPRASALARAEGADLPAGMFGEIAPARGLDRSQIARGRAAQKSLDLHLRKVKRVKRFGLPLMILTVLFTAFVIVPLAWVVLYRVADPPGTVLMLQRAAEGETIRHAPVPLSEISPHVIRSVIAAEDANFCAHDGFDIEAIQDALESNRSGGRVRGASTISQQTAKNLFLWPARSWLRKGFETYFTVLIETLWPKRRIMEAYLNAAEWGDGIFGIEAAAQERFGVPASQLTRLQAARLAAVLPSPNRWSADRPGPYVRRRSATIMQRARVVQNEGFAVCVIAPRT